MPKLLELPRETRDQILQHVAESYSFALNFKSPAETSRTPPLLLVNRQLAREFAFVLPRHGGLIWDVGAVRWVNSLTRAQRMLSRAKRLTLYVRATTKTSAVKSDCALLFGDADQGGIVNASTSISIESLDGHWVETRFELTAWVTRQVVPEAGEVSPLSSWARIHRRVIHPGLSVV